MASWATIYRDAENNIRKQADDLLSQGRISKQTYDAALAGPVKQLQANADYYANTSKSDRLKSGFKKVGEVTASTVVGLVTAGPTGALAGFAAGASSFQSAQPTTGIAPTNLVDVATPPIVKPGSVKPKTVAMDNAQPALILGAWVFLGWVVLKGLKKRMR